MIPRLGRLCVCAVAILAAGSSLGCLRAVTRAEVLETAAAYAAHEWQASPANVFHGKDAEGVPVDTPDEAYSKGGWASDGRTNVGVPYQWGGASSIAEFDRGVAAGRPAGHVVKRRDSAKRPEPSVYPVGVDCSGLVSQCWRLEPRRSTYDLELVCQRLASYDDLRPGDVLNRAYRHVVIFKEYVDDDHIRVRVYEAAGPHVREAVYDVERFQREGLRAAPLQGYCRATMTPDATSAQPAPAAESRSLRAFFIRAFLALADLHRRMLGVYFAAIGPRAAYAITGCLGRWLYRLLPPIRQRSEAQCRAALRGRIGADAVPIVAETAFAHRIWNLTDLWLAQRLLHPGTYRRYGGRIPEPYLGDLLDAQRRGQAAILVSAYYGPFDLLPIFLGYNGVRAGVVYQRHANPDFDEQRRADSGAQRL